MSAPLHTGLHPQADTPLADTPLADTPWADTPWADTPPGQTPPWADTPFSADTPRQDTPWADTPGQTPPCPVHAGIHTPPCPVHAGIHTPLSSACWDTHLPVQYLLGYGQQAGTTHPTGMHSVVDLRGGARDACRPPGHPNSFNFMQFLGNFGKIICWRPPGSWRPLLGEILDPPLAFLLFSVF